MNVNPFTPNFGQVPMYIAGRKQEISEITYALDVNLGAPSRTSIFVGARGCGKTALITYISDESKRLGWINVNVSCIPGIQEDIIQQAVQAANELLPQKSNKKLKGFSVGNLFSATWESDNDNQPNWRTKITEILTALEQFDTGIFITIDEVNPRLDEMIQIASVYQLLIRENRKIALLMAGLPTEVSSLLNDRSVSFLRRAKQYQIGRVEDFDVREAFEKTIKNSGKTIDGDALELAVSKIEGFPYMLQLVGYRAWEVSDKRKKITLDDVKTAVDFAEKDFESRVLRATVSELSDGDLAFLIAMLPDADTSKISDIEKRLKKNSGYVSRYRARLIEDGAIESSGRGKVRFAIPGLREYLKHNY